MRLNELRKSLSNIRNKKINFSEVLHDLKKAKNRAVNRGDQAKAKDIWVYEQIIHIHHEYQNAYKLIQQKDYYKGWCLLERIEISLLSLRRHFDYSNDIFLLLHVEKKVRILQVLFPYRLFASSELIHKKKICSICNKPISIRNSCGHIPGEIYDGEMCHRLITEVELLGIALVRNPVNKYAVQFLSTGEPGEINDNYSYELLDYFNELLLAPYTKWDITLYDRYISHDNYQNYSLTGPCPCGSEVQYEQCCLIREGVRDFHYSFNILESHAKMLNKMKPNIRNDKFNFE